ncbi:hypothetical protein [Thiomicrorhabdus sp. Milos-T2]|uniref:hypothetical protein n=1 Tax=Thiomicrorhabdus sp. Milos-T2 TaxID=90814 RepID=UPI00131A37F8|nr:hypothetical protein [Thiomicrorhabdus sp. Milos-T2]
MIIKNIIFIAVFDEKPFLNVLKHGYNEIEFAQSNSGFSRPFTQGVEITPSLSYDYGVFLCLSYYGDWKLGGLMPCRLLGCGLLTRLSVASMFLAGLEVAPINPRRTLMDNCIQNLPSPVNTRQKQILNKLLGRKRFNRDALEVLNNNGFISKIHISLVSNGWNLDLLTVDQQTATLKTLDGSKNKVFKSLDTVNEFLRDLGISCYVVSSEIKEVNHA